MKNSDQSKLLMEFVRELRELREGILDWVAVWRAAQKGTSDLEKANSRKWDHYRPEYLTGPNLEVLAADPRNDLMKIVYIWVSTHTSGLPGPVVVFAVRWMVKFLTVNPYLSCTFFGDTNVVNRYQFLLGPYGQPDGVSIEEWENLLRDSLVALADSPYFQTQYRKCREQMVRNGDHPSAPFFFAAVARAKELLAPAEQDSQEVVVPGYTDRVPAGATLATVAAT